MQWILDDPQWWCLLQAPFGNQFRRGRTRCRGEGEDQPSKKEANAGSGQRETKQERLMCRMLLATCCSFVVSSSVAEEQESMSEK